LLKLLNQQNFCRLFRHTSRGFTLIEVLIAMALLSIIGVSILGGLSTASRSILIADEQATAESLARSEMEYVKKQDYYVAPWSYELPSTPPAWDASHTLPDGYDGYTANVTAELLHATEDGIQKITVTIKHHDKPDVIILEGYRAAR